MKKYKITQNGIVFSDLILKQPSKGYRFNLDTVLLARIPKPKKHALVMDMGCGVGTVGLIAAKTHPHIKVVGVDDSEKMISLAEENAKINDLQKRCSFIKRDITKNLKLEKNGTFDAVYFNPPYYILGQGRPSPDPEKNHSKYAPTSFLKQALTNARRALKCGGTLYLMFTPLRLAEIFFLLKSIKLEPKKLLPIYGKPNKNASNILLWCIRDAKEGMELLPPLTIRDEEGNYTKEALSLIYERK